MHKCLICGEKFTELEDLYSHIEEEHPDLIPKDFTAAQYHYFLKTGKDHGSCIINKKPTKWNPVTNKYNRFCEDPKCKQIYRDEFKKRMIGKHGKIHLLSDPEQQKKMLANRSISGEYSWSTDPRLKFTYTGSYELDFIRILDLFFDWDPEDLMMPSPHTYYYQYEGEKKFYIPDAFIPSLNLEIEIKDGGDNPNNHHKIQDVDKVKEKLKDGVLMSQKSFSYIKLTNKNYEPLFDFLMRAKQVYAEKGDIDNMAPIFIVNESVVEVEVFDEAVMEGVMYKIANKLINHSLNRPGNVLLGSISTVNYLRKVARTAKTKKEIEKALEIVDRHLGLMKRNKNYKLNHGNVIPVVDKKLKEPMLDKTIEDIEDIKHDLEQRKKTVTEMMEVVEENAFITKNIGAIINLRVKMLESASSFNSLKADLMSLVDKAKTTDDIKYLKKELSSAKKYVNELAKKETRYKDAANSFVKWLDEDFAAALDKKMKTLSKVEKSSVKEGLESKTLQNDNGIYLNNILESATTSEGLYPVYILLTYTATNMAKLIRFQTGDPYSHASITFDSSLHDIYSFGRKYKDSTMSFVNEDINDGLLKDVKDNADYSLYVVFVADNQLKAMYEKLNYFKKKKDELKYSFLGLFNIAIGKETHAENQYFCSQFVAEVLRAGNEKWLTKDPSLYTPYQLARIKPAMFVERGKLKNYSKEKVDRKVAELMKKL